VCQVALRAAFWGIWLVMLSKSDNIRPDLPTAIGVEEWFMSTHRPARAPTPASVKPITSRLRPGVYLGVYLAPTLDLPIIVMNSFRVRESERKWPSNWLVIMDTPGLRTPRVVMH